MALPLVFTYVAVSALGGAVVNALSNNSDQRAANQSITNAQLQSKLFEKKIGQLQAASTVESESIFMRAAEVRGERLASLAGRGISLDSQVVDSVNLRERENVVNAVNTIVSNAYMEAENLRVQGRLGVTAAQTALQQVRDRRSSDILLGGLTGVFQAGANLLAPRGA